MEENEMSNEEQRPVPVQQDEPELQWECAEAYHKLLSSPTCPTCGWSRVPVQQDEPEGTCRLCAGEGWFGWEGVKVPGQRLLAQRKAHCKLCDGTGVERPVPVQQDEPEACDHVWRSSFGDTFCEKCNQDFASDGEGSSADPGSPPARQTAAGSQPSPVPVQQDEPEGVCAFPNCSCTENRCPGVGGEPCRGCGVPTGVGAYHHIGCRTPEPNPVPVQQDEPGRPFAATCPQCDYRTEKAGRTCSACGLAITVPVQQEPELAARILDPDFADGFVAGARAERAAAVSSVGLRDRIAEVLRNAPWEDKDTPGEMADAVLSVLHEAGTQEDSLSQLVSDTGLIREVARLNVELCDMSEKINDAVARWMDEAKRRKERLTATPAVSGTPDTKEDEHEL